MKETIRKELLEKRKQLSKKEVLEKSKQIKDIFLNLKEFKKANNIFFMFLMIMKLILMI